MTDVVLFLDALDPSEAVGALDDWKQGEMDAGVPRVTPNVLGSVYTGLPSSEHGMMELSRYGPNTTTRPKAPTFIDQLVAEGKSVLSLEMPFTGPFPEENSESVLHSMSMAGGHHLAPEGAREFLPPSGPSCDALEDHPDDMYAAYYDETMVKFHSFKESIRKLQPDVAFLGYRLFDGYCHFQHEESRNGKPYRQHLVDVVASLSSQIASQVDGDVMYFSDHGQRPLTDVFRANRWLAENGYLKYNVDYEYREKDKKYTGGGHKHPSSLDVSNQITLGKKGVTVDMEESEVVCGDNFDSAMTLLTDREDFDAESFREDLLATGMYRDVKFRWEVYDEDAQFYDTLPHVIPDRGEGVFVSTNLHREPIGMGYQRTGVHDFAACYGSTKPLSIPEGEGRGGRLTTMQMYDVIADFVGLSDSPSGGSDVSVGDGQDALSGMETKFQQVIE